MTALAMIVAAKLVVVTANGIAITDYPDLKSCQRAAADLQQQWKERAIAKLPPGYKLMQAAPLTTYCITDR